MKKTALFSALISMATISALILTHPISLSNPISAAENGTAETTPAETPPADPPATDAPVTDTPVTDEPIVQPEVPEPAENSVFLTHSSPLRAGEEVTFTFSCSGENVRALQGTITYDNTLLTYNNDKGASTLDSGWLFTVSDNPEEGKLVYVGLSSETDGASGVSQLFSLSFTLSADAVTGNTIPFHVGDATALKGNDDLTFSGGPVTFLVDRPISVDSMLSELTVSTGTLAPEFDPTVTDYRLQVPFDCEKLELTAVPGAYATIAISDTALEVGNNTVTITVTSEAGTKQVYTLTVTRLSDPNYVPSDNSLLTGITLSDGMLFPAFSPSITEYTVYLVNEGSITLTPIPAEWGSAEPATLDGSEGSVCTLTSLAEDGSTTVYTFRALRVQTPDQLAGSNNTSGSAGSTNAPAYIQTGLFLALLAVVAVTLFFVGFGVSNLASKRKKVAIEQSPTDSEDSSPTDSENTPPSDDQ